MPRSSVIPDDVWADLDPRAGDLSRRARRVLIAGCVGLVLVLTLLVFGYASGIVVPRVSGENVEGSFHPASHDVSLRITLTNNGSVDEHVTSLRVNDARFATVPGRPLSLDLPAHESRTIWVRVHVTDCAAFAHDSQVDTQGPVDFSLTTHHWWGSLTRPLPIAGAVQLSAVSACG